MLHQVNHVQFKCVPPILRNSKGVPHAFLVQNWISTSCLCLYSGRMHSFPDNHIIHVFLTSQRRKRLFSGAHVQRT